MHPRFTLSHLVLRLRDDREARLPWGEVLVSDFCVKIPNAIHRAGRGLPSIVWLSSRGIRVARRLHARAIWNGLPRPAPFPTAAAALALPLVVLVSTLAATRAFISGPWRRLDVNHGLLTDPVTAVSAVVLAA